MTCPHGIELNQRDCIECMVASGVDPVYEGYENPETAVAYNGHHLPSEVGLQAVSNDDWQQAFDLMAAS